jgi:hypothetical protein
MCLSTVEDRDSKRWGHAVPISDSHSQSISFIEERFLFPSGQRFLSVPGPWSLGTCRVISTFSPPRLQASYRDLIQGKYRGTGKSSFCNGIRSFATQFMRNRYPLYACGLFSIPCLCVDLYPGYAWKSATIHTRIRKWSSALTPLSRNDMRQSIRHNKRLLST